jgi:hypothetical protein
MSTANKFNVYVASSFFWAISVMIWSLQASSPFAVLYGLLRASQIVHPQVDNVGPPRGHHVESRVVPPVVQTIVHTIESIVNVRLQDGVHTLSAFGDIDVLVAVSSCSQFLNELIGLLDFFVHCQFTIQSN